MQCGFNRIFSLCVSFVFCRLQQKFTKEAVQLVPEIRDREHMSQLGYSSTMTPPLTPCKLPCINAIGSYIYILDEQKVNSYTVYIHNHIACTHRV